MVTSKYTSGFTLIELVLVIIILGILATTAAPKFLDLSNDAKASILHSLAGSIKSGSDLVHDKAVIHDKLGETASLEVNGVTLDLRNGYPAVDVSSLSEMNTQLQAWVDINSVPMDDSQSAIENADFIIGKSSTGKKLMIFFAEDQAKTSNTFLCQIFYRNRDDKIEIEVFTDEC